LVLFGYAMKVHLPDPVCRKMFAKRTFAKYVEPKEGSIEIDENGN
jgi:hypothetical protein